MGIKRDLLMVVGLMAIGAYAITNVSLTDFNTTISSFQESVKTFQEEPEEDRTDLTTGHVVEQAKKITQSECDPNIWMNWSNLTPAEQEGRAGLAQAQEYGMFNSYTLTIDLHIDDTLTNQEDIKHTAWHECGHAKTYNISSDKVDELYSETLNNFSECKGYEEECLADSMAEVKTGIPPIRSYLGKPSTQKQLETAEKVWKASDIVNHKNKRTEQNSWIDISIH